MNETARQNFDCEPIKGVDIARFDFSTLVGHKVTLFADQFPGKPLASRVVVANGNTIAVDRSGSSGLIDNLVNNQQIVLQVKYKGEPVSVQATVRRTDGGGCKIHLGETVVPLLRRRFRRLPLVRTVRLATLPMATFSTKTLAMLRWVETDTVDVSGGGALIKYTSALEYPTYLFMNVACSEADFPSLLLGQVRYSISVETGRWNVGVEFIPRESRRKHFAFATIRQMPAAVFAYDEAMRADMNQKLIAWMQKHNY
ncbi:MAG: PilZ domain-containing protein [Alphaproteobacteria bacterium]|nr:PilZ domain-containing protein [Alphaproteobacteria bacterium]